MKRDFRRVRFSGLCAIVLGLLSFAPDARADLTLDITRGNPQPLPIAIPGFLGQGGDAQVGTQVSQVVSADLERSGLFKPLDPRAFIQDPAALVPVPRFADWKLINAQALVSGAVTAQPDGHLKIDFRLWDVLGGTQMVGFSYNTPTSNWREIAHIISDQIYKRITGEDGYFNTRIVYISESGPAQRRIKRLAIMDQDGFNNKQLTDGRALVLTPRFSPAPGSQEITYLSYAQGVPQVFLFNIDTRQQEVLGQFPGMTFAPRFSPDGNKIIFSLSGGANSQIYTQDLRTRKVTQITSSAAIDTGPSYSPDGSQITFESDRGGTQQVYVMNADGSNQHRVSFGTGRYATPVWSPRGDLIAFTKQEGGNFSIGVMQPDGQRERILTSGFLVEGPTWAPNGRVLMYFKQSPSDASGRGDSTRLYSIDLTGFNEREVVTPQDGSDPAWSPLLQ
ncbi:MAG TPA: Tol-Pal system beta propeller repeat protein TolB [Aliidongia sp.]|uniref:Tol-Pal system beta propeller repeat protein TolB n=1 Tax=Aliidongia sp. TaxID=1914230 RepID=UPI002DDD80A6|nr:Tol-Pal system beta propeller repeat protein TolB [Aliidongia sp.]HEV2676626.1 Tol-Pal system beta propeller repeat protein TolB [Aliidongia sp.]